MKSLFIFALTAASVGVRLNWSRAPFAMKSVDTVDSWSLWSLRYSFARQTNALHDPLAFRVSLQRQAEPKDEEKEAEKCESKDMKGEIHN